MATTLLQAVNDTLNRAGIIQGANGDLTSLTNSGKQLDIDLAVDCINEVISSMMDFNPSLRGEVATSTFETVEGTREYSYAADYEGMISEIIMDQTNGYPLRHYQGGYQQMFMDQYIPANYDGAPCAWVINPITEKIRLDTTVDAASAGKTYTYIYRKELILSGASDTLPFSDGVWADLKAAVNESWSRERHSDFDGAAFLHSIAKASRRLYGHEARTSYR